MDEDERAIELDSIAAIYPELQIDPETKFTASIDIAVAPEKPLKIVFQSATEQAAVGLPTPPESDRGDGEAGPVFIPSGLANALKVETHELSHLPPVTINIELPLGYPSETAPAISISVVPQWLPDSKIKELQDYCGNLWEELGRAQVVFSYLDYIQEEANAGFRLVGQGNDHMEVSDDLKLVLLDHDMRRKREEFENGTYECGVCLEPKKGRVCHKLLLCGHVFCVGCLQDFYNNAITEGDVDAVKCLSPGCAKDVSVEVAPGRTRRVDKSLNPSELLQIPISRDQVQRYVRLKRKKALEADKSTIYCPRSWCQGAAKSKKLPKSDDPLKFVYLEDLEEQAKKEFKNIEDTPMADRLCVCEDCEFAFCSVCKRSWHGENARCNPRRQAEISEEEKASEQYMDRFSTGCPTCNARSQKSMGCNHMICFKCKTHFCYLCSAYLMPENPYHHFNDLKSTCYMRLWELEGGDGADAGQGYGGGEGRVPMWQPEDFDSDEEEELPAENMEAFAGDPPVNWHEVDSSDDEEPAPDQRRPDRLQIEIIGANGQVRRMDIPQAELGVAPIIPPAAAAARVPPRRQVRRRNLGGRHPPAQVRRQQPAQERQIEVIEMPNDLMVELAAPGQGNNVNAGLQRFLQLALQDREDEWDSDEEEAPDPPVRAQRHRHR